MQNASRINTEPWSEIQPTALLVLADGTVIEGTGIGAKGAVEAEVCFNTAMTGYEEILTDPSYTGQVVVFTFPHIGNVGVNEEDIEILNPTNHFGAVGTIFRASITNPSNYRSTEGLQPWLEKRGIIGICGIDTRALTALIREKGLINALIAHDPNGNFENERLQERAAMWRGIAGCDLAATVSCRQSLLWKETPWIWNKGYGEREKEIESIHIVVIDYGIKRNILRLLAATTAKITVIPANSSGEDVLQMRPDGVFLSNGPGDPTATAEYAVPTIKKLLEHDIPLFGVCLGHQMLALAVGAKIIKMHQGHHGANHPVKNLDNGDVKIVSMNHGFTVDSNSLPEKVEETHVSLFDGSNCGIRLREKAAFSVQYHPESSPGPQDSHYLFRKFDDLIKTQARSICKNF